jgi:MSHA biogenesis protein MshJ
MKLLPTILGKFFKAFDDSSMRQRMIVAAAIFIAMHGAWDKFFYQPQLAKIDKIETVIEDRQNRIAQFGQVMQKANITSSGDAQSSQIAGLERQIAKLDSQIETISSDLITPDQMPDVLQQLLTKNNKLKLTHLDSESAELLVNNTEEADVDTPITPVYRHALTLQFEGDYLSTLDYILAVEQLDWRIFWDSVRIYSDDYPHTRVSVSLYTLSLDEGWIGV